MLLYDSVYDQYRGVICIMAIADGKLTKGVYVCSSGGGIGNLDQNTCGVRGEEGGEEGGGGGGEGLGGRWGGGGGIRMEGRRERGEGGRERGRGKHSLPLLFPLLPFHPSLELLLSLPLWQHYWYSPPLPWAHFIPCHSFIR